MARGAQVHEPRHASEPRLPVGPLLVDWWVFGFDFIIHVGDSPQETLTAGTDLLLLDIAD